MCERILAQNCQKFDNFNLEFSMSHHNARYQSYKNAPYSTDDDGKADDNIMVVETMALVLAILMIINITFEAKTSKNN